MLDKSVSNLPKIVLMGGGHSHAIFLKQLQEQGFPEDGEITLISNTTMAPYSGMLPGYLAGFYEFKECHIDLIKLTQKTKINFIIDEVVGLDLADNLVLCRQHRPVFFDILSIDIGSTPASISVPGAADYAIPAKPVPQLLAKWSQLQSQILAQPKKSWQFAIVGGGAGGVEMALSLQAFCQKLLKNSANFRVVLVHKNPQIMPTYSGAMARLMTKILLSRNIQLYLRETVTKLEKNSPQIILFCESGLQLKCDQIFWVTQASAPAWLRLAGLTTTEDGFILINNTLQSVSHPHIFACGDIATLLHHPTPKAGVFAVRQGKPLYENMRFLLEGKPLKPYIPQKQYLSLIGTGTGQAVAARGNWCFGPSQLLWIAKDWIDRQFMAQFN